MIPIDYVGYILTAPGTSVVNDSTDGSTVLDLKHCYLKFGENFDVSKDGEVIAPSAIYDNAKPNRY